MISWCVFAAPIWMFTHPSFASIAFYLTSITILSYVKTFSVNILSAFRRPQNFHRGLSQVPTEQSHSEYQMTFFRMMALESSEDSGSLGLRAEEASEVKVLRHQLLFNILQCPLMLHNLQRLPFTLRSNTKTHHGCQCKCTLGTSKKTRCQTKTKYRRLTLHMFISHRSVWLYCNQKPLLPISSLLPFLPERDISNAYNGPIAWVGNNRCHECQYQQILNDVGSTLCLVFYYVD